MLRRTRRAPTACSWCHHRKVRCDASILGCPCTRCRQDGRTNCVLRRKLPKQSESNCVVPPSDTLIRTPQNESIPSCNTPAVEDLSTAKTQQYPTPFNEDHPFLDFSRFKHLPPENMTFLYSKGALEIPDQESTHEFVHQYFKEIHPMLPVIDEAQFWDIFTGNSTQRFSLFVFQALLFVSCSFVEVHTLRQCGFVDKRDARTQLYNRAKLLFDLQVEMMPFAKAQGAILLTHHTSADSPLAGSLWLTCAIENAMIIDAQPSMLMENVNDSLKKRLWWSILLRDRSLCIGLRRRPQVTSMNLHGCRTWLEEEDFADEMHASKVHDYRSRRNLLCALQEQCQLAVLLTDLTSIIFSPRATPASAYGADKFDTVMDSLRGIKKSLAQWRAQAQSPPGSRSASSSDASSTLRNLTFMYYHTAQVDLAQYTALLIEENSTLPPETYEKIVLEVGGDLKAGIEGLTAVMRFFSLNGHVDNLPLSVLGYVGMPLVLAAIDLKLSPSRSEATTRQKTLDFLSQIIRQAEALYDVTDFVAAGTNHILQLAYVTTQHFFLNDQDSQLRRNTSRENNLANEGRIIHTPGAKNCNNPKPPRPRRPKNWHDAYLRCPRAYLLISTCVDYSLSVGRLPYGNSLPSLVRDIPAMCSMAQLPWIVSPVPIEIPHDPYSASASRGNSLHLTAAVPAHIPGRIDESPSQQSDATAATATDRLYPNTGQEPMVASSRRDNITPTPNPGDISGKTQNAINLDFLDFDVNAHDPSLASSSWPRAAEGSSYGNVFDMSSNDNVIPQSTLERIEEDILEHDLLDAPWVRPPEGGMIEEGHLLW